MKKIAEMITLLTLVLALLTAQAAWAEPSDAVKGVFEALLSEGSGYSQLKASYTEYFPDTTFEETLRDDGFTIAASGNEYMQGAWDFAQDGDYLALTLADDDFSGLSLVTCVIEAVGRFYGMNTSLINTYVNGLSMLDMESDSFIMTQDTDAGTNTVRINIAGPWDMKELDQMALEQRALYFDALGEDSVSCAAGIGKLMMVANGSVNDVTILLGEYGGLDELARQSIVNVVSVLQPKGWEDFTASYTQLADTEAAGYTVQLNVDSAAVAEIIDDVDEGYSYALIHFGA